MSTLNYHYAVDINEVDNKVEVFFFLDEKISHDGEESITITFPKHLQLESGWIKHLDFIEDALEIKTVNHQVYPNPASDMIYFSGHILVEYDIMTIQGNRISQGSSAGEIDISQLKSGIYLLRIDYDGYEVIEKFIKIQ